MVVSEEYRISTCDFVLDCGGGHNPFWRADCILEKYIDDNLHRGENVSRGVSSAFIVQGSAEDMPFKTKSFDYIFCNHVLEHSHSPEQFVKELSRVGKRGYVGTPSPLYELIYAGAHPYHIQYVANLDGSLVCCRKKDEISSLLSSLAQFHELLECSKFFRDFFKGHYDLFKTNVNWEDQIQIQNESNLEKFLALVLQSKTVTDVFLNPRCYEPAPHAPSQHSENLLLKIVSSMRCVKCGWRDLTLDQSTVQCDKCGPLYWVDDFILRRIDNSS
jgi:SAM-dependent methyltransferase